MSVYFKHAKVVLRHKYYVMRECFKAGLYWQGLLHDIGKFSIKEFFTSARYFQGTKSPIDAEKEKNGYSYAWLHHMGHNQHHWQFWIDYEKGSLSIVRIPPKYVVEMLCDWIGAGKAYNKNKWTPETFISWAKVNIPYMHLHEDTMNYVYNMLKDVEVKRTEQSIKDYISVDKVEKYYEDFGKSKTTIVPINGIEFK
jgi:hypothetical protein